MWEFSYLYFMDLLSHLPEEKQREILAAVEIIKEEANPEKIILFGSHATGKWVDSSYVEDGMLTRMKEIVERICEERIKSIN